MEQPQYDDNTCRALEIYKKKKKNHTHWINFCKPSIGNSVDGVEDLRTGGW